MSLPYWIENLIPAPWDEYWESKPENYLHAFRLDDGQIRYVHIEKKDSSLPDDEYDSYRYIRYDKLTRSELIQITTKFKYKYYEVENEIITYGQDKEGHPVWFGVKFVPNSLGTIENTITYTITTPYNTVTHNINVWGTGIKEDNVSLRRTHAYQQHEFGADFPGQGFNFYEWLEENPEYKDNRYILGGETYYWGKVWVPDKTTNHYHKLFMPKDLNNNRQELNVLYVEHKTGRLVLDPENLKTRLGLKEKLIERMETLDSQIDQLLFILTNLKDIVYEQYCELAQELPIGLIYAVDNFNQLVTIDPISGESNVLTNLKFITGQETEFTGIAFDYNGIMWGIDGESMYAINFNTGYCFKAYDLFKDGYKKLSSDKEGILYSLKPESYSINTAFKTEYEDVDVSFLDEIVCQDFDANGTRWIIGKTTEDTNNSLYIFYSDTNEHLKLAEITEFFPDLMTFHVTSNSMFGFSNNNRDVYEIELDNEYSIKNYIEFDSNDGEVGYIKCLTSWSGFVPRKDRWLDISKETIDFANVDENSTKTNTVKIKNLSPYSEKVRVTSMSNYFFISEMDNMEEILLMPSNSEVELNIIFDATRLIGSDLNYESELKVNISGTNDNQETVFLTANVKIEPIEVTTEINYSSVKGGEQYFSEEVVIYNPASFSVDVELQEIVSDYWKLSEEDEGSVVTVEAEGTVSISPILTMPDNPEFPFYDAILQVKDMKRETIHSTELKASTEDEDFLEITPENIIFSDVILNTTRSQNIKIKSLSNFDKYVYINIDHPDYYEEGMMDRYFRIGDKNILKFLLKSRQEVTKELTFTPYLREDNNYNTFMTANFERSENIYNIPITATSSPVPVLIEPPILEFADREVGVTVEDPDDLLGFYITNISSEVISFINIISSDDFEIYGPIPEIIAPDERFFIGVRFRPRTEGLKDSYIQISKMTGEEIIKVGLKGLALPEGTIQIGLVSLAVDPPIVGADNLKWGLIDTDAETSGTSYYKDYGSGSGSEVIVKVSEDIDIIEAPEQEDVIDIELIEVPPGEFEITNSVEEDEKVFISNYNIGKYPITNEEFLSVMNWAFELGYLKDKNGLVYNQTNISNYEDYTVYAYGQPIFNPYYMFNFNGNVFSLKEIKNKTDQIIDTSKHPVVLVSWYGAVCFCNWLSQINGRAPSYSTETWNLHIPSRNGYRLPTEAEWEKAAGWDGTKMYKYGISRDDLGEGIDNTRANYFIDSSGFSYPIDYKNTMPIKLVPVDWYNGTNDNRKDSKSPYECYSMAGNATEWCHDWFNENYPESRPTINPFGSSTGTSKTVKNGNYTLSEEESKISKRISINPQNINLFTGFRIVQSYTTEETSDITELINPLEQGAKWRFKNEPEWNDFGKVENLDSGTYTIQFLPLKSFETPPEQEIYVQDGGSYEIIANYIFRWNDPSYTKHEYSIGNYKTIWINEETQEPVQEPEEPEVVLGNNSVKVILKPEPDYGGVTFGLNARWRLTSGPDTDWNRSSATASDLPDGNYRIEFTGVEGYATPSRINIELSDGEDYETTAVYYLGGGIL